MIKQHSAHIFQGNWEAIRDREYKAAGITAIICVNENNEQVFPEPSNDMLYLWASFNDPGEQLTHQKLTLIIDFGHHMARNPDARILVHCLAGANRSSAISALLMHYIDDIPIDQACRIIAANNAWMGICPELTAKIQMLTGLTVKKPEEVTP
jgi:hypothetical protein